MILPLEDYENIKEEIEMLNSKKLTGDIFKARQEIEKGEVYSLQEVRRKLFLDK